MKKRLLTVLIAVCLVLALGTVTALADDAVVTDIDGLKSAVQTSGTITIGADLKLSTDDIVTVPQGVTIVLDMQGHRITVDSNFTGRPIVNNGTLTVTGNGTIDSSNSKWGGYGAINNYGTLTIENGTYIGNINADGAAIYNRAGGELTINDGYFTGTAAINSAGRLTINDGSFCTDSCNQYKDGTGKAHWAYCVISSGELYFYNGSVTGVQGALAINNGYAEVYDGDFQTVGCEHGTKGEYSYYALYIAGEEGKVEAHIYGGTYTAAYRVAVLCGNDNTGGDGGINARATANIHGGTFVGGNNAKSAMSAGTNTGDPTITGGTFTYKDTDGVKYYSDVSKYIPDGSTLIQNTDTGEVIVDKSKTAIARVDGVDYTDLASAIAAADSGDTITILNDIPNAVGISVPSGKNFTIDFGGHTYTLSGPGAGSTNTETNGFQLLKDSTIVFKNGTIRIAENANNIKRVIQNYANLTLEDMHIYAENQVGGEDLALSLNYGSIRFKGDTDIITTDDSTIAFDVYFWDVAAYQNGLDVTFDEDFTGTINGVILYDSTDPEKAGLNINGNGYIGDVIISSYTSSGQDITVTGGTFGDGVADVAETPDYELASNGNYTYHETLAEAMAAADEGDTINFVGSEAGTAVHTVKLVNNGVTTIVETTDSITLPTPTRSGYEFRGWRDNSGKLHKAGDVVTVNSDMVFTAVWSAINIPDTYDIEIADTANGSVDTSLSNASAGSTITITATPDSGYSVASVTVTGPDGRVDVVRVNATTYTFRMPAGDVTVRVTFTDSDALPFTDASAGQWFYDAVAYVYTNGMMEGDSATTFNPDGTMTRAMFWAVLGRIDGATITGTNWADQAREWAMAEGVSDGTDPNGLVTREQMVTMLWRYAGEPESSVSLSAYTDADSVSDWAETAMRWAIDEGIIAGMTDTTLVPQGTATRAQCAAIFMRFDQM